MSDPWKKKSDDILCVVLILSLAVYYIWRMVAIKPWYDELYTYYYFISRGPVYAAIHWPLPNNHFLYSVLSAVLDWSGNSLIGLRGCSLVCAVGNLVWIAFLSEKIFGTGRKSVALCLYAGMEMVNYYAVQGRGYTLSACLYLTAIYCLYRICCLKEEDRKYYLLFSAALAMGLYTVVTSLYWVVPLCIGGGVFLLFEERGRIWRLVRYSLLAALSTFIIYSLVWIALGCNLLQDTSNSPYYGWEHLDVLKADVFRCWLCGERFMRGSEWVQSIPFRDVWHSFGAHWRLILNELYTGMAWPILFLCGVVLVIAVIQLTRKDKVSARERFLLVYLVSAIILTPAIMLVQSALPYSRVYSFVGVPLTFGLVYCLGKLPERVPAWENAAGFVLMFLAALLLLNRLSHPYYNRQYGDREEQFFQMVERSGMTAGDSIILLDEYQELLFFFRDKTCKEVESIEETDFLIMPMESVDKENPVAPWPAKFCYADFDWDYISREFEWAAENEYYQLFCRKNLK